MPTKLAPVEATVFEVEQAGCPSCAALVRDALEEVATVLGVTIDEDADLATVLVASASLTTGQVDELLREASPEGHAYRVRPGSWRAGTSGAP
jgi:copper chaperone CopZ